MARVVAVEPLEGAPVRHQAQHRHLGSGEEAGIVRVRVDAAPNAAGTHQQDWGAGCGGGLQKKRGRVRIRELKKRSRNTGVMIEMGHKEEEEKKKNGGRNGRGEMSSKQDDHEQAKIHKKEEKERQKKAAALFIDVFFSNLCIGDPDTRAHARKAHSVHHQKPLVHC